MKAIPKSILNLKLKFLAKIEIQKNGCWKWTGNISKRGYGRFSNFYSHRVSFEMFKGKLGSLYVCHTCDWPTCVNPDHLFLGTAKDNTQDMISKKRRKIMKGLNARNCKMTEEKIKKIVKFFNENKNMSVSKIARHFDMHTKTCCNWLKMYNCDTSRYIQRTHHEVGFPADKSDQAN